MTAAVALRDDFSASELRRLAKHSKDANQSRRLLALAAVRQPARPRHPGQDARVIEAFKKLRRGPESASA